MYRFRLLSLLPQAAVVFNGTGWNEWVLHAREAPGGFSNPSSRSESKIIKPALSADPIIE